MTTYHRWNWCWFIFEANYAEQFFYLKHSFFIVIFPFFVFLCCFVLLCLYFQSVFLTRTHTYKRTYTHASAVLFVWMYKFLHNIQFVFGSIETNHMDFYLIIWMEYLHWSLYDLVTSRDWEQEILSISTGTQADNYLKPLWPLLLLFIYSSII